MQYQIFSKLRLLAGFRGRPFLNILWFDKDNMCCGKNTIFSPDYKSNPPRTPTELVFDGIISSPLHAVRGTVENRVQWNCVQANKLSAFEILVPASMTELRTPHVDTLLDNWVKSEAHV